MKIILGSSSPRRKEILEGLLNEFEILIPHVDEKLRKDESPVKYSERVSWEKADFIFRQMNEENPFLIITCDTIVTLDSLILGKPADFNDARNKLRLLNGRTHRVISSITLIARMADIQYRTSSETSYVTFKTLTGTAIDDYLNKIDYTDKAGAYAVQEQSSLIIHGIKGSISNVKGFPLALFYRMLTELNLLEIIFF